MCECITCANTMKAKREIDHGCDGPITAFVLISRTIELARKRKYDNESIANALHESLNEYGWLTDNGKIDIIETGS